MLKHATMSIWSRAEDGSYKAELNGFSLDVRFRPEHGNEPRGFLWSAVTPTGERLAARESEEEIEIAMGVAEFVASGGDPALAS